MHAHQSGVDQLDAQRRIHGGNPPPQLAQQFLVDLLSLGQHELVAVAAGGESQERLLHAGQQDRLGIGVVVQVLHRVAHLVAQHTHHAQQVDRHAAALLFGRFAGRPGGRRGPVPCVGRRGHQDVVFVALLLVLGRPEHDIALVGDAAVLGVNTQDDLANAAGDDLHLLERPGPLEVQAGPDVLAAELAEALDTARSPGSTTIRVDRARMLAS